MSGSYKLSGGLIETDHVVQVGIGIAVVREDTSIEGNVSSMPLVLVGSLIQEVVQIEDLGLETALTRVDAICGAVNGLDVPASRERRVLIKVNGGSGATSVPSGSSHPRKRV